MDKTQALLYLALALFALGLCGVVIRRNLLVMLMSMELMLNGVNLPLVTFANQMGAAEGAVLVFLIFVVATARSPSRSRSSCCWPRAAGRSTPTPSRI